VQRETNLELIDFIAELHHLSGAQGVDVQSHPQRFRESHAGGRVDDHADLLDQHLPVRDAQPKAILQDVATHETDLGQAAGIFNSNAIENLQAEFILFIYSQEALKSL